MTIQESRFCRRQFLETGVAAALMAGTGSLAAHQRSTDRIPLTVAGYPYDRVNALADGQVPIEGCDVTFETSKIGDANTHVFAGPQTRDVSEIGLIPYLLAFCNGGFRDYEMLPIPVLKVFRHKSIFVRTDAGITKPADLRGRKVATPGYSSSGLTWIRGILQDEYKVHPEEIRWVLTAKDSAAGQTGGASDWEKQLPTGLKYERAPEGVDESDLLISGEVDAICHPAEPRAYVERHPRIDRLFPDHRTVEQAYFRRTGIFPIMHMVVIRRALADEHPWLRKAVFEAYSRAKQADYAEMKRILWAYSALPWYGQELNETRALMGENFYSYGLPQNRAGLEAACRYLHEQGLAERLLTMEELFHPSTRELDEPV